MTIGQPFNPWRVFTGVWIPDAIIDAPEIIPSAKILLGLLFRYAGKRGECWPSQQELGRRLHMDERNVRNLLSILEENGLVQRKRRGLGMTDIYLFLWSPLYESGQENFSGPDWNGDATQDWKPASTPLTSRESEEENQEREERAHDNLTDDPPAKTSAQSPARAARQILGASHGAQSPPSDRLPGHVQQPDEGSPDEPDEERARMVLHGENLMVPCPTCKATGLANWSGHADSDPRCGDCNGTGYWDRLAGFNHFLSWYPNRGESEDMSCRAWISAVESPAHAREINGPARRKWEASAQWRDPVYIPNRSAWLLHRKWRPEVRPVAAKQKRTEAERLAAL